MSYFSPQTIFDGFIALIAVVTVYSVWQNSKNQAKVNKDSSTLLTLQLKDEAINQLTKETARLNAVLIENGKDIAVLKAENERLTKLVENRDPALERFMKDTTTSIQIIQAGILQLLKAQSVTINN